MSSIFTKIINREIPSDIVYEDDELIVIKDIAPKAKTHLLIIPKLEIESINQLSIDNEVLISKLILAAKKLAFELKIDAWYQLHINVWKLWGQEVPHLHIHLLSDI